MKKNTGITLVALVITIIILLILAGVAISMITGGEGLFAKANSAAGKYNQAAKNEADLINQLLNGNYFGDGNGQEEGPAINNESHVGYYADIEGDGKIDGIIFADLAVGGSGEWNYASGAYTIPVKTGLKEYYESQDSYTASGFDTKPVLSPKEGSTGEDRFYIMALEDFGNQTGYNWYHTLQMFGYDEDNLTSDLFGRGRENSYSMIDYWNTQGGDSSDLWGCVQDNVNDGWFVPSKEEWSAFAGAFGITPENFEDFGLQCRYWSSSIAGPYYLGATIWWVDFEEAGCLRCDEAPREHYGTADPEDGEFSPRSVRLSTCF